jgi:hypothetical protein
MTYVCCIFEGKLLRKGTIVTFSLLALGGSLPVAGVSGNTGGIYGDGSVIDAVPLIGCKSRKIENIYKRAGGSDRSQMPEIRHAVARSYSSPRNKFSLKKKSSAVKRQDSRSICSVITDAEKKYGIPRGLLMAIATVESKVRPYAVNVNTKAYFCNSKEEAKKIIVEALRNGRKNISIGCLQLLYRAHNAGFSGSIDNMLDPEKNIMYGASYMKKLYKMYGSWELAVKKYHSNIVNKAETYYCRVMKNMST